VVSTVRKAGEAKGYLKGAATADVLAKHYAIQVKPSVIVRLPDRAVYVFLHLFFAVVIQPF
jgi:hypothetical protein